MAKVLCKACRGTKRCPMCRGIGSFGAPAGSPVDARRQCRKCHCTGACQACHGKGWLALRKAVGAT